jgi:hypothetical protein
MAANGGATGVAWDYFWPGQAGQARHRVRCDSSDTEIRQNLCSRLLRLIVDLERVVTLLANGAIARAMPDGLNVPARRLAGELTEQKLRDSEAKQDREYRYIPGIQHSS